MNKFKKISIATLGTLTVLCSTVFASTGTVNAPSGLVLREKADKNANPLTTVDDKQVLEIIEENGEWFKVKYGIYEGYMFAKYVNKNEEEKEEEANQEEKVENPEIATEEITREISSYPKTEKIKSNLNIYLIPSVTSKIIANIDKDKEIIVNYELNDWLNISIDGITGWARKYFVINEAKVDEPNVQNEEPKQEEVPTGENEKPKEEDSQIFENRVGYIDVSSAANIRETASTSANIINTLLRNTQVSIIGEEGEFYKIKYQDIVGYISKALISDTPAVSEVTSRSTISRNIEKNIEEKIEEVETKKEEERILSEGEKIAEYAKKYIGYSYVYGGTTPSGGFDCTGFAFYVYNACGYKLSRSCSVQCQSGIAVEKENLQAGDLLLFCNGANGTIGHVGIYLGDGRFIHAENPNTGVKIDTINSGYYLKYYYQGRRIVK